MRLREWFVDGTTAVFLLFFRGLNQLGKFQRGFPWFFHIVVASAAFGSTFWAWHYIQTALSVFGLDEHLMFESLKLGIQFVFAGIVTGVFGVLIPLVSYTPHAMAMKSMGLERCATKPRSMDGLLRACVAKHPEDAEIKIITIAGWYLFRQGDGKSTPPLLEKLRAGRLDVVMPETGIENPTIQSRWNGYNQDYKDTTFRSVTDLEQEVAESKALLLERKNQVTSHDLLCMWQVVLFKDSCLVQNYFPNASGRGINEAPVFVFERIDPSNKLSYYAAFDEMFKLAKAVAVKRHAAIGVQTPAAGMAIPATPPSGTPAAPPRATPQAPANDTEPPIPNPLGPPS